MFKQESDDDDDDEKKEDQVPVKKTRLIDSRRVQRKYPQLLLDHELVRWFKGISHVIFLPFFNMVRLI
jgi:hypothetical protein